MPGEAGGTMGDFWGEGSKSGSTAVEAVDEVGVREPDPSSISVGQW